MKNLMNSFIKFPISLKIVIIFIMIITISGVCTATYMISNNISKKQNVERKEYVEVATSIDINNIAKGGIEIQEEEQEEQSEEQKEEKTVTYKDKEIKIPKTKVAQANSAEDSQKQKTGGSQMTAQDAVSMFENEGKSIGIDVSAHQGKINWAEVKNSGIEFAMIRCGFRGQTAGEIYQDAYFKSNINGAVSNGVKVGIYFYSCAINEEEALQEAAWVVNTIKSYRITYPVVYDFEDFERYRCVNVSGQQATLNAIAFLDYVKSAGYTPMMYANKTDITSRFSRAKLSKYKFWLAHYTTSTNYTGSYQMWQHTSNGSVPGISGRVDMNVAYFRYGAVAEPKHTHDFDNGTVVKTNESKEPTCTTSGTKFIRCTSCSELKKIEIPSLGGHKYGNWITEINPTEEKEGLKTRKCNVCGYKEEVTIPKLEKKENIIVNDVIGNEV